MPTAARRADATPLAFRQSLLPTREGMVWLAIAGVLLIQGYLRGVNLVALLACLLIALWLLNLFWLLLVFRLREIRLERRIEGPVFAEQPFKVSLEATNPLRRNQPGLSVQDRGSHHRFDWFMPMLRAGTHVRRSFETALPRRGRYYWPELVLRTGYPFGLFRRILRADAGDATIVLPQLGHLQRTRLMRLLLDQPQPSNSTRKPVRRNPAAQTEFYGLREFRTGDSPRWIHWRTTARVGELMVREFVEPPLENLTVILEPWLPEAPPARGRAARPLATSALNPNDLLEKAISLAATICWEWSMIPGARLGLGIADRRPVAVVTESGQRRALVPLERLALVEGTANPDVHALLAQLHHESLPPGPVVLVTTRAAGIHHALSAGLGRPVVVLNVADDFVDEFFDLHEAQAPVRWRDNLVMTPAEG